MANERKVSVTSGYILTQSPYQWIVPRLLLRACPGRSGQRPLSVLNHQLRFLCSNSPCGWSEPIVREQSSEQVDRFDIPGLGLRPKNPIRNRFTIRKSSSAGRDGDPEPVEGLGFFPEKIQSLFDWCEFWETNGSITAVIFRHSFLGGDRYTTTTGSADGNVPNTPTGFLQKGFE